jgi:ABC-type multidrug transport system fused ATPase/permease subunit
MTTELMLIGMKYQAILNRWIGSFPIVYDYNINEYKFDRDPRHMKFYYFCIVVIMIVMSVGCIYGMALIHFFIRPVEGLSMAYIVIYLMMSLVGIFLTMGVPPCLVLFGKDAVMSINALIKLFAHLKSKKKKSPKQPVKYKVGLRGHIQKAKDLSRDDDGNWDLMGAAMVVFASFSAWFPPFFGILATVVDMEVLKYFALAVFGGKFVNRLGIRLLISVMSFIIMTLDAAIGVRLVQVIIILYIITLQFYLRILHKLEKMFGEARSKAQFEKVHME